jgi:hypothetical protein
LSFGYNASLDKKKQYEQSMLQVDPLGFAKRWNAGGESACQVSSVIESIRAPFLQGNQAFRRT